MTHAVVPTRALHRYALSRAVACAVAALLLGSPIVVNAADDRPATSMTAPVAASSDAATRAAEILKAISAKAGAMDGTWTLSLQRAEKAAGTIAFSVRGPTWTLTTGSGPSATTFYCDGEQVYDLQKQERYDLAKGGSRLPEYRLLQLMLANVRPAAFLGALGDAPAARTQGDVQVLRFQPRELPKAPDAPQVIGQAKRATDVTYDAASGMLSSIAGLSLDAGRGTQVRVEAWAPIPNNEQGSTRPSRLSIVNVEEDKAGALTASERPILTADVAYAPLDATQLDAAAKSVAITPFFTTPRDALRPAETYRARMAQTNDRSDAVALAQATFAARDLADGLTQWTALEGQLGDDVTQRQRLTKVLSPVAAEAAWFSAKEKDKAAGAVAVLAKMRQATDDAQWRFVAPQAFFAWQGLRAQPALNDNQRQELDGQVLPRLCRSGNPSVLADLMRLTVKDATLKQLINQYLNDAASEPLPKEGYVASSLSTLVAAAINAGQTERASAWLANVKGEDAKQVTTLLNNAIAASATLATSTEQKDLNAAIESFTALSDESFKRDSSAAAIRQRLVSAGVAYVASKAASGQELPDVLTPTAGIAKAKAYWDGVVDAICRPNGGGGMFAVPKASASPVAFDATVTLARQYAAAFKQPDFESRTLLRLAQAEGTRPERRAARKAILERAMAAAPDDSTRVPVLGRVVAMYLEIGEPQQARAWLVAARGTVKDASAAKAFDALARQVEAREAVLSGAAPGASPPLQ